MDKMQKFEVKMSNFEKINPQFSRVKIYVMYHGANRNGSFMNKETIEKAIPSIFNIPVVGEYLKENDNFGGHGGKLEITDKSIEYVQTTMPYGVVPSDTTVEWEMVGDKEYLVVDAYLWMSRYPELEKVITDGSWQSMEIEVNDYEFGSITDDDGFSKEVAKIKDFTFSALCILGKSDNADENYEPCFEDAKLQAYSLDKFKEEFSAMLKELKFSLTEVGEVVEEKEFEQEIENQEDVQTEEFETETEEVVEQEETTEIVEEEEFKKDDKEDEEQETEESQEEETEEEPVVDDEEEKKKYELLETENSTLKVEIENINKELATLREFKLEVERNEKLQVLEGFSNRLSGEDLESLKENVDKFEKDNLEKEIAYLLFKNGNFALEKEEETAKVFSSKAKEIKHSPYGAMDKYLR